MSTSCLSSSTYSPGSRECHATHVDSPHGTIDVCLQSLLRPTSTTQGGDAIKLAQAEALLARAVELLGYCPHSLELTCFVEQVQQYLLQPATFVRGECSNETLPSSV